MNMNTVTTIQTSHLPPAWAFEFHGHQCPFMPLGYRMGQLAMQHLGVGHEPDHGFYVFPELGEAHPQTCLMDGIQVATGATYGKLTIAKTFYGKLAAIFYHPEKGAVRYSLRPEFVDALGQFEFFVYRKRGIEPSQIPLPVVQEIIDWTYGQPDEDIFKVEPKPAFTYTPIKGSFNKTKCSTCGEYAFDRYVRTKDGKPVCVPCSGY